MDLCILIEKLAYSIHTNTTVLELIAKQYPEVQKAFFLKNSLLLRKQLCDINQMPDKTAVFEIK